MAASTYWARLVHGNRYLRLDTEPFALGQNFSPPGVGRTAIYTEGIGLPTGGAERVSERFGDRTWTVEVRILGDTEAEVNLYKQQLTTFLELSRNKSYKLYFEYYPYAAIGAKPLWGQGVYNFHIKDAICTTTSPWLVRDGLAIVSMVLRIGPVIEGQRQRLASAKGMVTEDIVKLPNGMSRGLIVGSDITNLCLNPIFNNGTAWNSGWSSVGVLSVEKNTDPNNILFGDVSAKIGQTDSTSGSADFTTSVILSGTTCISAYIKRAQGIAAFDPGISPNTPGTTDIQFCCNGTALGSFTDIYAGDAWHRIYDHIVVTGTVTAGLRIMNPGISFYMDGFQAEQLGTAFAPNPFVCGDTLGCSWSGVRGASTSVSTNGFIQLPINSETYNPAEGCIRVVAKMNTSSSQDQAGYVFYAGTITAGSAVHKAFYNNITDQMQYSAGGTIISSAALTFVPNDIYVFHFVWGKTSNGKAQIALYTNGVAVVSDTFKFIDASDYLHIGNWDAATIPFLSTILDFTIYGQYIDAAHVAADYAQVYRAVTGGDGLGQRLNTIPYIWTKDGDNIVDSIYDGTHNDWAVINGIPGNMPAHTVFDIRTSIAGTAVTGLMIANQTYKDYLAEAELTDNNRVTQNVGTAWVSFPGAGTAISITRQLEAYRSQRVYTIGWLKYAGTIQCREVIHYETEDNAYYSGMATNVGAGTAQDIYYLAGPMMIPNSIPTHLDWLQGVGDLNFKLQMKRPSGSGTVIMDRYRIIPGTFMYYPLTGLSNYRSIVVDGLNAYTYNSNTLKEDGFANLYGEPIELEPGVYNHLVSIPAGIAVFGGTMDAVIYNRIYVTPRYSLA